MRNDIDVIEKSLNEDLASLSKWLDRNVMKVNVSKTKTMILGTSTRNSRTRDVKIIKNGTAVERVNTFKYLCITIDANLKWNDQINNICRKMCNSLGSMRRIKPFVPQSSLVTIYNTMFLPHLDYGIISWSNCGNTNLSRIQKLQNTAMRIILSAPFRTHINDMLKTLGFMDVRNRISYVTGCMMYKVINGMTLSYISFLIMLITSVLYVQGKVKLAISTHLSAILIMVEMRFNIKVVCYGMSSQETSETQILLCLLK